MAGPHCRFCIAFLVLITGARASEAPSRYRSKPISSPLANVRWHTKLRSPAAGDQVIFGEILGGITNDKSSVHIVRIRVSSSSGELIQQQDVLVNPDNTIVGGLKNRLEAGQIAQAFQLQNGQELNPSMPVLVGAAVLQNSGSVQPSVSQVSPISQTLHLQNSQTVNSSKPVLVSMAKTLSNDSNSDVSNTDLGNCDVGTTKDSSNQLTMTGVHSGAKKIQVSSILNTGTVYVCIAGQLRQIAAKEGDKSFQDHLSVNSVTNTIFLSDALKTNEDVLVVITSKADPKKHISARQQVAAGLPTSPRAPELLGELRPGSTNAIVIGEKTPANAGYEVRIRLCAVKEDGKTETNTGSESVPLLKGSDGIKLYELTDTAGKALLTFDQPLRGGESFAFCEEIVDTTDSSAARVNATPPALAPVNDPLDLGRIRYYFTSGIVLSNNSGFQLQSSGTQAGLFLGLDTDRAWLPIRTWKDKEGYSPYGYRRWNINTYFDARLTSVATQGAVTTGTSTAIQSFTQSRKAASFQTGIYIPVDVTPWNRGKYSMFLGPLAKTGFVTLTDDTAVPAAVTGSANGSSSATVSAVPITNRFYTSYAYGARLGVFQHFLTGDAAPEIVSYVDIATGRFGNFEPFRDLTSEQNNGGAQITGQHEFLRVRPWRYSFEGLLKIPQSPFVIGFNANIGQGAYPAAVQILPNGTKITRPFTQPRDDLRFLFGARFDAAKLLKIIPQL